MGAHHSEPRDPWGGWFDDLLLFALAAIPSLIVVYCMWRYMD